MKNHTMNRTTNQMLAVDVEELDAMLCVGMQQPEKLEKWQVRGS